MRIAVIGGGPAGMMAAASAAESGAEVTLFEKNEKLGKKLYITGKGRCNVTNVATGEEFLNNVATNPKFLYAAMSGFSSEDTVRLIEKYGVKLKVERGGRLFPVSDKASDITSALADNMKRYGVRVMTDSPVSGVNISGGRVVSVVSNGKSYETDVLIVATGGISYPTTGSNGDGMCFARNVGLEVVSPKPSLCGLTTKRVLPLMGLTLKNVGVTLFVGGKKRAEEFGELLFTHTGVSGPTVLTLSSKLNKYIEASSKSRKEKLPINEGFIEFKASGFERKSFTVKDCRISIDLKPALTMEALDKRVLRDFEEYKNRQLKNALSDLLPMSLIPVFIECGGLDPEQFVNTVTKAQRAKIVSLLKAFEIEVTGFESIDNAIVTSGGVSVKEIDASSMRSKRVPNLYFAGEVMDVDAVTGGFNIQLALSTGRLAGLSAAQDD